MGLKIGFVPFIVFLAVLDVSAQLKVYPLAAPQSEKATADRGARIQNHTLTLPVWDDFSTSAVVPNDAIWQDSENVFVNTGLGLMPPSYNVASFDGLKWDGSPYSTNPTNEGRIDALTTHKFDFSGRTSADAIYLSFFYQFGGFGESPDDSDSIRVEFLTADSVWIPVWPDGIAPLDRSGDFVQVLLPVTDADYLHDAFRFRFQAYGRQSGPFDVWNIDYVYINSGRSANDDSYPDRALATPLAPIFGDYTAIPRAHATSDLLSESTIAVTHLDIDDFAQNVDLDIIARVTDYLDGVVATESVFSAKDISPGLINPGQTDSRAIPNLIDNSVFTSVADSSTVRFKVRLDSNDSLDLDALAGVIDFTINDYIEQSFTLNDYYAYDDGTAEVGVGLNFSGNRLAIQYDKYGDTLNYIKAFDIYFPFVNASPNGKSIDLTVWSAIDTATNESRMLYKETIAINTISGLNRFTRFELQQSVLIEDTVFYIGYRQNTAGDLAVGFDRNTDTSDRILFNVDGTWEVNTLLLGSLMIRPVFTSEPTEIVGLPEELAPNLVVYPNPTSGLLFIDDRIEHLELLNLGGQTADIIPVIEDNRTILDLSPLATGIYLLKFVKDGKLVIQKVIKQ